MNDSLWKREPGLAIPLGVAALGQFLVLLQWESSYLDTWGSMALHASPVGLLWLGAWLRPLERLGLVLVVILTGFALWVGKAAGTVGAIAACADIPVVLAALFPTANWLAWIRLFSWPALGFIFAGLWRSAGEDKPFFSSEGFTFIAFGLLMASWSYTDHRKDWNFRKQRRVTHFTLLPMSLLLSFGGWADHVTHGIRIRHFGYVAFLIALMGIFGFDPFGPEEPIAEGGSKPGSEGAQA